MGPKIYKDKDKNHDELTGIRIEWGHLDSDKKFHIVGAQREGTSEEAAEVIEGKMKVGFVVRTIIKR